MKAMQTQALIDDDLLGRFMRLRGKYLEDMAQPARKEAREKARLSMGAWVADYLDDAGCAHTLPAILGFLFSAPPTLTHP